MAAAGSCQTWWVSLAAAFTGLKPCVYLGQPVQDFGKMSLVAFLNANNKEILSFDPSKPYDPNAVVWDTDDSSAAPPSPAQPTTLQPTTLQPTTLQPTTTATETTSTPTRPPAPNTTVTPPTANPIVSEAPKPTVASTATVAAWGAATVAVILALTC
ncbi:Aste57867_12254 [Aphanomyces stellatus]|uniref:Aste57867_12254 protein n=1 Tax=Aphanomyces stellatus TaxID=120398 RepID=A0A485KV43_9STRA|nr:hypothetical protein As57867_012209 [Aphanomyces stellatus]VFT89107.1 Aste57867_12254 [Aphanomyces stellatus]